jgi:hypothetical protein
MQAILAMQIYALSGAPGVFCHFLGKNQVSLPPILGIPGWFLVGG